MGMRSQAALGIGDADSSQERYHFRAQRLPVQRPVLTDSLGHLISDPENGVQACHGLLEYHAHFPAPNCPQLVNGRSDQFRAAQPYAGARHDAGGWHGKQLQDRQRRYRLPATRLANQAQGLAWPQPEAHSVYRTRGALLVTIRVDKVGA